MNSGPTSSAGSAVGDVAPAETTLVVGVHEAETGPLARARDVLAGRGDVVVEPIDGTADADALGGLDCVVCAPPATEGDLPTAAEGTALPVVVAYDADAGDPLAAVADDTETDRLETWTPAEPAARLPARLRSLVATVEARTLARRMTHALESATDGMAIVAPDGTVAYANRLFAQTVGAVDEDLVGRPWQDLFAPADVHRLETEAMSAVGEGWRWLGTCEIDRLDGDTATVQTSITGAPDDSFVLSIYRRPDGD